MEVGNIVKVLPPFDSFSGEYKIVFIDGDGVIFLEGIEGGFAPDYLEGV